MTTTSPSTSKPITGRTVLIWLGAFFGVMFIANGIFVYLALDSWPGLSTDSAYKAGRDYNKEITAAKSQADLGWTIDAAVEQPANGQAQIAVTARDKADLPLVSATIRATLKRPVGKEIAHEIQLVHGGGGVYRGAFAGIVAGQWDLHVLATDTADKTFRSTNRIHLK